MVAAREGGRRVQEVGDVADRLQVGDRVRLTRSGAAAGVAVVQPVEQALARDGRRERERVAGLTLDDVGEQRDRARRRPCRARADELDRPSRSRVCTTITSPSRAYAVTSRSPGRSVVAPDFLST